MLQESPLLTIITVCFNSENSIETTIKNVLELDYPNVDYIIVDGASTDGTVNIIKKYEDKLKYWISEPDLGIYDAMNKGWAHSDPKSYVLFLGAGDKIIQMPSSESFTDADVVYGNVEIGDIHLFNSKHNFMLKLGNTIHHQAEFVRKSLHHSPPFNLKYKTYSDFNFNQWLLINKARFKKDQAFLSYAMEGGVSYQFNKAEPLAIVNSNFGGFYHFIASLYYFYKNGKL